MSPAATVLYTAVTFLDDDGVARYGYAQVPTDAAGVEICGDWDALGMRASGSHSITFTGVEIPRAALPGGFLAGDADAYMERNLVAGLFHAVRVAGHRRERRGGGRPARSPPAASPTPARGRCWPRTSSSSAPAARRSRAAATLVDESDEDTAGAVRRDAGGQDLRQRGLRPDRRSRAGPLGRRRLPQRATRSSRAYRDVRAGAFMHPLGANRAYDLLGDVALGRELVLH